jgi:hypothetical protein
MVAGVSFPRRAAPVAGIAVDGIFKQNPQSGRSDSN